MDGAAAGRRDTVIDLSAVSRRATRPRINRVAKSKLRPRPFRGALKIHPPRYPASRRGSATMAGDSEGDASRARAALCHARNPDYALLSIDLEQPREKLRTGEISLNRGFSRRRMAGRKGSYATPV